MGTQGRPILAALLLVAVGLGLNERVIADIAAPDGEIGSGLLKGLIRTLDLVFVSAGLLVIPYRRSPWAARFSRIVVFAFCLFLVSSVGLFLVLEWSPTLAQRLAASGVPYYAARVAAKEAFVLDPELVWRARPGLRMEVTQWRGDLYDPSLGEEVEPLHLVATFDRNGFRNPVTRSAADIVVLGDSFMEMGVDDEDTFAERLGKREGLSVVNLGLGFYGPPQYLAAFKRFGVPLKPRSALLCFFEGNDIDEMKLYHVWVARGIYKSFRDLPSMSAPRRFATALSDLALFLEASVENRVFRAPGLDGARREDPDLVELRLGDKTIHAAFSRRDFIYRADGRPPAELLRSREWNELGSILREFRQVSRENGIEPVVVFIPTKSHIYAPYMTERSGSTWLAIRDTELAASGNVEAAMTRLCDSEGIRFVSLAPDFSARAGQGELLYYPFDSHWNSAGREAAAAAVGDVLRPGASSR
jgi:acetyltransferase AlgX (SGNH hydrolase-like protein)